LPGGVTPFNPAAVNPASIDLCYSGRAKLSTINGFEDLPFGDVVIERGDLVLVHTLEYITMPIDAGGMLMLKSSMGRMGLEHLHAGWFDPSFNGTATLELTNLAVLPVVLEVGMPIVQLVLMSLTERPARSYLETGRYNGQSGPTEARNGRNES
jgi:dCTP deaminase